MKERPSRLDVVIKLVKKLYEDRKCPFAGGGICGLTDDFCCAGLYVNSTEIAYCELLEEETNSVESSPE